MLCRVPDPTDAALDFDAAWRVASTVDGWLTEAQARALYDAAARGGPGTGRRDRQPPRPLHHRARRDRRRRSPRSTRSPTTGATAGPTPSSASAPTSAEAGRRRARRRAASRPARRCARPGTARSAWSTSTASTTCGRCLDDLRWSALPAARRHGAGPRRVLLPRRDPRRCCATGSPPAGTATSAAPARSPASRSADPPPATGCGCCGELPWFARNLVVKVLLRLRLRPVAALLGHHDTADPYWRPVSGAAPRGA